MFAIFCRRRLKFPSKECIFVAKEFWDLENAVFVKSFSSSVCENDSEKSFTVSYLINSCGLSSKNAVSVSKKVCFESPEKPDAVLKLLRDYGFKDPHIPRIVSGFPHVLLACPNKILLPKLEFFRSIGVPLPVLAWKLSVQPSVLTRSLENSLIPCYNDLKSLLQSDEKVVHVFTRAPMVFGWYSSDGISSNISMLRERGMPESSIVSLVVHHTELLSISKEKFAECVDSAVEMGFDMSKCAFLLAIKVFANLTESTLKQKMEVYRRCGWSEPDVISAFLRNPPCMKLSEKKIMATMDFLINKFGFEPYAIAQCPALLNLSLARRIRPRCLVARILNRKGLLKETTSAMTTLLKMTEKKFLIRYIDRYEKDIPELLEAYQGEMGLGQEVISNI
ncbi:hypothetical protein OROGR_019322 [Orobanche gracilis]